MKYDKQKLIDLRDKVKAGEECIHTFANVFPVGSKRNDWLHDAFNASPDAAKALHDSVLPEWQWGRKMNGEFMLFNGHKIIRAKDDIASRSWLLAQIDAVIWHVDHIP